MLIIVYSHNSHNSPHLQLSQPLRRHPLRSPERRRVGRVAGNRVPAQHNSRAEVGQLQSWVAVPAEVDQPEGAFGGDVTQCVARSELRADGRRLSSGRSALGDAQTPLTSFGFSDRSAPPAHRAPPVWATRSQHWFSMGPGKRRIPAGPGVDGTCACLVLCTCAWVFVCARHCRCGLLWLLWL